MASYWFNNFIIDLAYQWCALIYICSGDIYFAVNTFAVIVLRRIKGQYVLINCNIWRQMAHVLPSANKFCTVQDSLSGSVEPGPVTLSKGTRPLLPRYWCIKNIISPLKYITNCSQIHLPYTSSYPQSLISTTSAAVQIPGGMAPGGTKSALPNLPCLLTSIPSIPYASDASASSRQLRARGERRVGRARPHVGRTCSHWGGGCW